jgi:hypothetical protein
MKIPEYRVQEYYVVPIRDNTYVSLEELYRMLATGVDVLKELKVDEPIEVHTSEGGRLTLSASRVATMLERKEFQEQNASIQRLINAVARQQYERMEALVQKRKNLNKD